MTHLRRGRVVEGKGSQVRVRFEDGDGLISCWLDCGQRSTKGKKSFGRYQKGELVRCIIDDKGETGEVIHAIYHDGNPAPHDASDVFYEEAADGAVLEMGPGYFRYTGADGAVVEVAGTTITLTAADVIVNGNLSVTGETDLKNTKINGIAQSGN